MWCKTVGTECEFKRGGRNTRLRKIISKISSFTWLWPMWVVQILNLLFFEVKEVSCNKRSHNQLILSTETLCLFTDQAPHKQLCIQLHLLTPPVFLDLDVQWPFGKVRFRSCLDLQTALCSDLSSCCKGSTSLRMEMQSKHTHLNKED